METCRQNGWMDILAAVCALYPHHHHHPEQSSIVKTTPWHICRVPPPSSFMYTTKQKSNIYIYRAFNQHQCLPYLTFSPKTTPLPHPSRLTYLPYLTSPPPSFSQPPSFLLPFFFHSFPYLSIHSFGACGVRRSIVISDIWGI